MDIEGQEIPELYARISKLEAENQELRKRDEDVGNWQAATLMEAEEIKAENKRLRGALDNLLDAVEQAINNIDMENRKVYSFASLQVLVNALIHHGRKEIIQEALNNNKDG
jgi:hypothetical protein